MLHKNYELLLVIPNTVLFLVLFSLYSSSPVLVKAQNTSTLHPDFTTMPPTTTTALVTSPSPTTTTIINTTTTTPSQAAPVDDNSSKTVLIIGISLGVFILCIIFCPVIYFVFCKNEKEFSCGDYWFSPAACCCPCCSGSDYKLEGSLSTGAPARISGGVHTPGSRYAHYPSYPPEEEVRPDYSPSASPDRRPEAAWSRIIRSPRPTAPPDRELRAVREDRRGGSDGPSLRPGVADFRMEVTPPASDEKKDSSLLRRMFPKNALRRKDDGAEIAARAAAAKRSNNNKNDDDERIYVLKESRPFGSPNTQVVTMPSAVAFGSGGAGAARSGTAEEPLL